MNIRLINNDIFNKLIQNMPCGFFIYSGTNNYFMNLNCPFYEIFSIESGDKYKGIVLGKLAENVVSEDRKYFIDNVLLMSEVKAENLNLKYRIKDTKGNLHRISTSFYRLPDMGLGILYYGFVAREDYEPKHEALVSDKIYKDCLTGAYNRNYFNDVLRFKDNISAIVIFDIDNFKKVNDTFGHMAGDNVLEDISKVVISKIRTADALVRFGGDEFIIVFRDFNIIGLKEKLHIIKNAIMKLSWEEYPGLRVTCSFGAICTDNLSEESLKKADAQLYKAKLTKNTACIGK